MQSNSIYRKSISPRKPKVILKFLADFSILNLISAVIQQLAFRTPQIDPQTKGPTSFTMLAAQRSLFPLIVHHMRWRPQFLIGKPSILSLLNHDFARKNSYLHHFGSNMYSFIPTKGFIVSIPHLHITCMAVVSPPY